VTASAWMYPRTSACDLGGKLPKVCHPAVHLLSDLSVGRLSPLSMVVLEHPRDGSLLWLLVGRPWAKTLDERRTSVFPARLIVRRTMNRAPSDFLRFPQRIFFPRRTACRDFVALIKPFRVGGFRRHPPRSSTKGPCAGIKTHNGVRMLSPAP